MTENKGVAFIINNLGVGGAERVIIGDANRFSSEGYKVTLFLLYGREKNQPLLSELLKEIECVYLQASGPFDFRSAYRLARELRVRNCRVLLSTLNDANIFARWTALFGMGRIRLLLREANDPRRKPLWQRVLDVLFDDVAARILAVSEDVRQRLLRAMPWRARRITVLRNAVLAGPQHKYNQQDCIKILTVGSLTEQKDHATLLAALAELKKRGIQFKAELIGGGPLECVLKEQAAVLDLKEVVFSDRLPHSGVMKRYEETDVFVLTSRWEGSPNVLLEAMTHGVPIVVSRFPGVGEFVEDRTSGLIVPVADPNAVADALQQLVENSKLRSELGVEAQRRAQVGFSANARFAALLSIVRAI